MKLCIQDVDLKGKKVLMRVDFNVPLNTDGSIADDTRLKESLPSIQYVLKQGGSVILMSHLGRPKNGKDPELSLAPCAKALSKLLRIPVLLADDCIGEKVKKMAHDLKPYQVLLLENLRFYPAEENPELAPHFAEQLAQLGDVYINDAFGTAHRSHSSTAAIAAFFPKKAAAGFLMQKEIEYLNALLNHPKRPFYTMIGGAKVSTKIDVLKSLVSKVDGIFIGGGMAYTFFKAQGYLIGNSLCEEEQIPLAKEFLHLCALKKIPCWLPEDCVIADAFTEKAHSRTIPITAGIPNGWQGMDIGPQTISHWKKILENTATLFWNGPLGVFEFPSFAKGTEEIAIFLSQQKKTLRIVGGGDTIAAINRLHLASEFTHLSTGGGASLEYIEFGHLPGIDALSDKK